MEYVNTFSEFNRLSIRDKFSPFLRAWYLLRHHNTEKYGGSGWLPHKEALFVLGVIYKQNRPREIMKSGEGKWWEIEGEGYRIYGIETIKNIIHLKPGYRVEIPIEAFTTLQKFRAFSYATFFAFESSLYQNEKGKNISRATLKEIFDISVPTQIKYEEIASIRVTQQDGFDIISNFDGETEKYISEAKAIERYKKNKEGYFILTDINKDGFINGVYQIANNYYVDTVFYKSKENRRVKKVRGSEFKDGASPNFHPQRYFDHKKQLQKRLKRKNQQYGYVLDKDISARTGKPIYQRVSKWS
jgi:hypothetical protein